MPAPPAKNEVNPTPKVTAATVGTALASLMVFVAVKVGLEVTDAEAVAVTGSLATCFTFLFGYVKSN